MCKVERDVLENEKGIQLEEKKTQQNNEKKTGGNKPKHWTTRGASPKQRSSNESRLMQGIPNTCPTEIVFGLPLPLTPTA